MIIATAAVHQSRCMFNSSKEGLIVRLGSAL